MEDSSDPVGENVVEVTELEQSSSARAERSFEVLHSDTVERSKRDAPLLKRKSWHKSQLPKLIISLIPLGIELILVLIPMGIVSYPSVRTYYYYTNYDM